MKKFIVLLVILALTVSCTSNKVFENYELSYSRSGGYAPLYENVLIKGKTVNYFFEGHGKKYNTKATLSEAEKLTLYKAIKDNNMKFIQEDHLKMYDNITTTIKMKNGGESIYKNDGSGIKEEDHQKWNNIATAFENFINSKNLRKQ